MDNKKHSVPYKPTKKMLKAGEAYMTAIPPNPEEDLEKIWQAMIKEYENQKNHD